MATYLAPGVYVEEFDSGPVPLAGGATAVAGFVGFTERLPTENDKEGAPPDYLPRLVTSWTQYQTFYGGFGNGDWTQGRRPLLPAAVYAYFNNGGTMAYITPLDWREPRTPSELDLDSTDYYRQELEAGKTVVGIPAVGAEADSPPALTARTGLEAGEVSVTLEPSDVQADGETPNEPEDPAADPVFGVRVRVDGKAAFHCEGLTPDTAGEKVATALAEEGLDPELLTLIAAEGTTADTVIRKGQYALVAPEPNPKDDLNANTFQGNLLTREPGLNMLKI